MSNFSVYFKSKEGEAFNDQQRPLSEKHLIDKFVEEVLLVIKNDFLRDYDVPQVNTREEKLRNSLVSWLGENCPPFEFPLVIVRWQSSVQKTPMNI